jgi:hypothetical protein
MNSDEHPSTDDSGKRGFIPGIYNHCDRWCERCPLTARCFLFAEEKRRADHPKDHDVKSDAFWRGLHQVFESTKVLILHAARQHGIDLDAVDQVEVEQQMREMERARCEVRRHPLVVEANYYAAMVDKWFERNAVCFEEKHDELESLALMELDNANPEAEAASLTDACEVIRWYQYQIAVKFARALTSYDQRDLIDPDAMEADALGSAKVALVGIDRSIAAWAILRQGFPEQADELLELLVKLDRLRRTGEAKFPDARAFVRPGLDE